MVPAGEPTQKTVDKLAELLDDGDTIVDGGNSKWTDDKARRDALEPKGIHYVDVGTSGGVWGLRGRLLHDGRRPRRGGRAPRADPRRARPARAEEHGTGWGHFGADRRRPLREDGPQRHRVRADAGLRRGLRPVRQVASSTSTTRRSRTCGCRARSCARGCASWRRSPSSRRATTSPTSTAYTDDSGEGRWTIEDAMDKDVPTPVITASLYARFYTPRQRRVHRQDAVRAARAVRRPRHPREGGLRVVTAVEQRTPSRRTRSPRGSSASRSRRRR